MNFEILQGNECWWATLGVTCGRHAEVTLTYAGQKSSWVTFRAMNQLREVRIMLFFIQALLDPIEKLLGDILFLLI
jgi:hypothetical protein